MGLSLVEILAAKDCQPIAVNVPQWDGDVHIAVMSGTERDTYEHYLLSRMKGDKLVDSRGLKKKLLSLTLCDESGARLCNENGDADRLFGKSSDVLQRLFEKSQELNGLSEEAVDETAKNLLETTSAGSG